MIDSSTIEKLIKQFQNRLDNEVLFNESAHTVDSINWLESWIDQEISHLGSEQKQIIKRDFIGLGPIGDWMMNLDITEIIINDYNNIWVEINGQLIPSLETFISPFTYNLFVNKILRQTNSTLGIDKPIIDTMLGTFRICIVDSCITQNNVTVVMRHLPKKNWALDTIWRKNDSNKNAISILQQMLFKKKKFLIVGPTGTGKTTLIKALINELPSCERCILIEDTPELHTERPNNTYLVTRTATATLPEISQSDLVKAALRLRPDRIIMGEIRGKEAKDFLLALSTGHDGSFGSIHAESAAQALIRLEMLIKIGAPEWCVESIRKLIFLSINAIIVLGKDESGNRYLKEISEISSLEKDGLLLNTLFQISSVPDI